MMEGETLQNLCRPSSEKGKDVRGSLGNVAQLGERCFRTAEVAGSTPVVSTNDNQDSMFLWSSKTRRCRMLQRVLAREIQV